MQLPGQAKAGQPAVAPQTVTITSGGVTVSAPTTATAADVYRAFKSARSVLGDQRDELESTQRDLSQKLQNGGLNPIDQKGLEQRLTDVNARITAMDQAISEADARVANAAAVPGATVRPEQPRRPGPPDEVYALIGVFMFIVVLPMSIAFSRRIWRRGANKVPNLPKELGDRLTRLDQAVEAIAVEVERVGEAQRFMTNVMTDQGGARALGAGPAERFEVRDREKVGARQAEF